MRGCSSKQLGWTLFRYDLLMWKYNTRFLENLMFISCLQMHVTPCSTPLKEWSKNKALSSKTSHYFSLCPLIDHFTIDCFTDTAAILISIVTIYYYGMLRGQTHINLPPGHPIMFFETIEIKMAARICKTVYCVRSCLASEWKWDWSWIYFYRNLLAFISMMLFLCQLVGIYIRKAVMFQSKKDQLQPYFHSKAKQLTGCLLPSLNSVE